jgi:hypothetical protein
VFEVMHDACEVGGLMIHESPFTGWTSHGFYCLQPSLFYDVARANGYEMVLVATEHLRSRSFAELRRATMISWQAKYCDHVSGPFDAVRGDAEEVRQKLFKVPTQGIYCGGGQSVCSDRCGGSAAMIPAILLSMRANDRPNDTTSNRPKEPCGCKTPQVHGGPPLIASMPSEAMNVASPGEPTPQYVMKSSFFLPRADLSAVAVRDRRSLQ